jgi:Mn2+/Fe2+ NRAMP family transporter
VEIRNESAQERLEQLRRSDSNAKEPRQEIELLQRASAIINARAERYGGQLERIYAARGEDLVDEPEAVRNAVANFGKRSASDHQYWAAVVAIGTAALLVFGRYGLIQTVATILVASFTVITIVNLFALQTHATYSVGWNEILTGMSFRLTPRSEALGVSPLVTALATFGIIGVGGNELISYPYWCLEKGYARFAGPRDPSPQWAERARGWLRVMRWDAWCSMVVYTFATIAFYLLGAAILHKIRLFPEGTELIRTLAVMYEPVFGAWAQVLFLFGAFAVLYSTFFVANAGHARVVSDALRTIGVTPNSESSYRRTVRCFSGLFPLLCLCVYLLFPKPTKLVLYSGVMQAILLPMLSGAALYFRYRRMDERLAPGKLWDLFLWLSALGMLVTGGWLALTILFPALKELG